MTLMSIALLHVDRCSARVATPSDTVKDKEPIRLPSRPHDGQCSRKSLTYLAVRLFNWMRCLDHAPYQRSLQGARAFDRELIVGRLTVGSARHATPLRTAPSIPQHSRVPNPSPSLAEFHDVVTLWARRRRFHLARRDAAGFGYAAGFFRFSAERNARHIRSKGRQLRLHQARGDDSDARRNQAADGHSHSARRAPRADTAD